MIRHPEDKDLPGLRALWQEAFGDSAEETAYYFTHRHRHGNMLVYTIDDDIAGMLSMLPLELVSGSQVFKARYIFAVATKKSFRSRGISTELLESAHRMLLQEGCTAALLVPAEPSLFTYYGKRGYHTAFMVDQMEISGDDLMEVDVSGHVMPCSAGEYKALRDRAFAGSSLYARWDEDALRFIGRSVTDGGGAMLRLEFDGLTAAAVLEQREGFVRVNELVCAPDAWHRALALIHQQVKAPAYQLRLQEGHLGMGREFGMLRWLSPAPELAEGSAPYLAFAKD